MTPVASEHAFWLGPNTAFVLAIFGVLGIYCEFIWPGRIYPAMLGSAALAAGAYFLWRLSPSALGLWLIAMAILLFAAEAIWKTYFVAGISGTAVLAAGFCEMFHTPPRIVPWLAIPVCCAFGAATCLLCYAGRHARKRKWADLKLE